MNYTKILRNTSFTLLAVTTAVLAVMTVGIHFGWPGNLYTSWPMVTLWALTAAAATIVIFHDRLYRNPVVFGLHMAFLTILAGACITHFCAVSGTVHLRVGELPAKNIETSGNKGFTTLPFGIVLQKFETVPYPGTDTPRNYVCSLFSDNGPEAQVSMNHPGMLMGWTFVLGSYDNDGKGVTFNVTHDPWGVGLSYAGYIMLVLTFIGYFFLKKTCWRISLRKLAAPILLLAFMPAHASVNKEFASCFGNVLVNYNGRICPMTTVARDFTTNLSGGSASEMNSVLAGFLFDFSDWKRKPLIRIKNNELKEILKCGRHASYEQFFDAVSSGRLNIDDPDTRRKFTAEIDRFENINMLVSGEILRIFPIQERNGGVVWLSPTDPIPSYIEGDQWMFIRKYLGLLNEQVQRNDADQQTLLLEALRKYQKSVIGDEMPSDFNIRTEGLYNRLSSVRWPPLAIGLFGLMLFLFVVFRGRNIEKLDVAGLVFAILSALFLLGMIVMRWIVSGHVPLSNGYETMQFLSLVLLVIAILFWENSLLLSMGILASGLALGVSVLGGSGSSISGLMPVLDSPLLSIHVMLVMMSYALFLLMALTGIAGLINSSSDVPRFAALIEVMLYPALALLSMGIFIGAVWANVSWGRYWGWDPKEVWALITLLTYSFAAHPRLLPWLRKPRVLMWFSSIAFITVLITYFGVNFILGGLHSYA